ncbi:MAG: hypothetical protein AB7P17_11220 [Nitrospirales bacterium]
MLSQGRGLMALIGIFFGMVGYAGHQDPMDTEQVHLGRGIVEGTKGYQLIQRGHWSANEATRSVQGQVFQIEGAAYVVHTKNQIDIRLPVDENTRIDRPAHVGDWIEAQLDQDGRARIIRNIDGQISLE